MSKDLVVKQDTKAALLKTKNLISITNKILNNKLPVIDNDEWIQKLWKWADKFNIDDLYYDDKTYSSFGCWRGIPRDKDKLLNLKKLYLYKYYLDSSVKCNN